MPPPPAPTLIERSLLLDHSAQIDRQQIERLAEFQRGGRRVLLVAVQPRSWRPTRRRVDRDLALQKRLQQLVSRAGGELDGVLYLDTGLFSRRHQKISELEQIARRYGRKAGDCVLIGSDQAILEAAAQAGMKLCAVGTAQPDGAVSFDSLRAALEQPV